MAKVSRKVILVGDASVGKTSMLHSYLRLIGQPSSTVGVNIHFVQVLCGTRTVNLNIWDTAGSEQFKCMVPLYSRDAAVAVLVYSQDNPESFIEIQNIHKNLSVEYGITTFIVVANKFDLEEKVRFKDVKEWCNGLNIRAIRASAKTGANIFNVFMAIADKIPDPCPSLTLEPRKRRFRCL